MAIRWLKDIGVIKRVLAESETSARLVAIRSLELMLDDKALEVLEESHANAISFEKYFIEKAIQNINDHKKTGLVPVELQIAFEREERLKINLANALPTESTDEYEDGQIEIGDLESKLIQAPSNQESVIDTDQIAVNDLIGNVTDDPNVSVEEVSSVSEIEASSEVQINNPSETLIDSDGLDSALEEAGAKVKSEAIEDLLPPQNDQVEVLHDTDLLSSESDDMEKDSEVYDDLLPPMSSAAESFDDLLPSGHSDTENSYEDLLPPLNSNSVADNYDDLLPPLQEVPDSSASLDSFDDLLPPMETSAHDFQGSSDLDSLGLEDNLDDLLPAIGETSEISKSYEDLMPFDEGANFDDLLPPLGSIEQPNDNLNDLLPAAETNADYDDLLPPQSSDNFGDLGNSDYDDLLPPLNDSADAGIVRDNLLQTEGWDQEPSNLEDSYDDLLPPLKKV